MCHGMFSFVKNDQEVDTVGVTLPAHMLRLHLCFTMKAWSELLASYLLQ